MKTNIEMLIIICWSRGMIFLVVSPFHPSTSVNHIAFPLLSQTNNKYIIDIVERKLYSHYLFSSFSGLNALYFFLLFYPFTLYLKYTFEQITILHMEAHIVHIQTCKMFLECCWRYRFSCWTLTLIFISYSQLLSDF